MENEESEKLDALLPHRKPMTMLKSIVSTATPGVAEAIADVSRESIFYDASVGGVPAVAALEYMAQTMALAVGSEYAHRGVKPRIGFVLGTRKMEVSIDFFDPEKEYTARAKCIYTDEEFASFECSISCDGETVAEATLTAFQPPEGVDPMDAVKGASR